jgi:hypothetical protein
VFRARTIRITIVIRYTGRMYNLIRSTEHVRESTYGISKVGRILKYGNTIRNTDCIRL